MKGNIYNMHILRGMQEYAKDMEKRRQREIYNNTMAK